MCLLYHKGAFRQTPNLKSLTEVSDFKLGSPRYIHTVSGVVYDHNTGY